MRALYSAQGLIVHVTASTYILDPGFRFLVCGALKQQVG